MDMLKQPVMVPTEVLEFYQELVKLHEKYAEELPPVKLTRSQKDSHIEQKAPLLNFIDWQLNEEKVSQAITEVCQLLYRHRSQVKESVKKIELVLSAEEEIRPLVEKVVWQNSSYLTKFAEKHDLDNQLLFFVLYNAVKPFIINEAKRFSGQYSDEFWQQSFCPVCGWNPMMAVRQEKTNQRKLHCSFCDTEWTFKNLECPHCLNDDHETMKYFSVEGDKTFTVNVCDKCHGYIKTVDENEVIEKESALLTDIKTLYLDILAEKEGYKKEVELQTEENLKQ